MTSSRMSDCMNEADVDISQCTVRVNGIAGVSKAFHYDILLNAAMAQWVRAFARQAERWVVDSQPRQTSVVKTGSESSTA